MLNIQKQVEYWISGAEYDIISAQLLIKGKRTLHGLFFCHLVIEKAIKAHWVKRNNEVAPRSHNLIHLSEGAGLEFDSESHIFLGVLMNYQLQGRYPDYKPILPDENRVNEYLNKTKELLQWLKMKL